MTAEPPPEAESAVSAPVDLRTLAPGAHLIVLYRSEAELARVAVAFVVAGLEAGDQVLYVADDGQLPAVHAVLTAGNPTTKAALDAGQLAVCRFSDVYGAADGIRAAAARARTEGFPGLRIAAEMGDHTRVLGSIEQVLAWERLATRLQRDEGVTSVCQYHRQQLNREHQKLLTAEHAGVAPDSLAPPLACFLATPQGMRITGELDVVNRDECMRVVEARLVTTPRLVVDVSGVTFIDLGTLRRWYALAAGLPESGHITLAHASPELRCMIELLGWRHPSLRFDPPVESSAPGTGVA